MAKIPGTQTLPAVLEPRTGTPGLRLAENEFRRRFLSRFQDPVFSGLRSELDKIAAAAWDAYSNERKAPNTRKAGTAFKDPDYDLSVDWLAARDAIHAAQERHSDLRGPARILLISGSSRSEHTCPGEMSKSYRLARIAQETIDQTAGVKTSILELHRLTSEYGRTIHPCKACFSASPALCHWPCSCYPAWPGRRLDERHLSDVGRGARHHDRHACELVSGLVAGKADDGSAGLRGWRQSGPHPDTGQGCEPRKGA